VPQLTRFSRISLAGVGVVVIATAAFLYGLFHGYFDHGQFEIKQSQSSITNQVAMVAERSDREALGGLEYYVLIGDHVFTPVELRHAYYSSAVAFSTSSDCLALRWDGPNRLIVRCNNSTVDKDHINAQRRQVGNISIAYENIELK